MEIETILKVGIGVFGFIGFLFVFMLAAIVNRLPEIVEQMKISSEHYKDIGKAILDLNNYIGLVFEVWRNK